MIKRTEVEHIARLAKLALTEQELESMTRELGAILQYVQQLGEVDTSGVGPTAQAGASQGLLRSDEARPGLERARVLDESPGSAHDGFAVPAFVDD